MATSKKRKTSSSKWSAERWARFNAKKAARDRSNAIPLVKQEIETSVTQDDPVNHPRHYNVHPSGVECIDIVEHMSFNLGNAVKYIWRYADKDGLVSLDKAIWYIQREKQRLLQKSYSEIRDRQEIKRGPR